MRNRGIDALRGLGIFVLLGLHSAFYYFGGLYEVDFNDPPLIITIIGFLLMFAGLFAIISGYAHTCVMQKELDDGHSVSQVRRKQFISGGFILVIAYLYFLFTGPGIVHFETESMNNSLIVEWIQSGQWVGLNLERLFYIDSLVMIGVNIILLGMSYPLLYQKRWNHSYQLLLLSLLFLTISLVRIPLYELFIDAWDAQNWWVIIPLNLFANKNNPIFPYFAFALVGAWIAAVEKERKYRQLIIVGGLSLVIGMTAYLTLPDTMLERAIDLKWYSIMIIQIGVFLFMMVGALKWSRLLRHQLFKFFEGLGLVSLTPFFFESIVAAMVYRLITWIVGPQSFTIGQALLFGFTLAIVWGIYAQWVIRIRVHVTLEHVYSNVVSRVLPSTKSHYLKDEYHP